MALFTLEWNGDDFFRTAEIINEAAMVKAANLVSAYAKTHMTNAVTAQGRNKRGRFTRKTRQPSAPGEPPAIDTGILRASLIAEVTKFPFGVTGRVGPDISHIRENSNTGTDVEYGLYLELGTRKMAARPFLRPALNANIDKIQRIFRKANR